MKKRNVRLAVAGLATAAIVPLGAGVAAAQGDGSTTGSSNATTSQPAAGQQHDQPRDGSQAAPGAGQDGRGGPHGPGGRHGGPGGRHAAELAEALNINKADLHSAMEAAHQQVDGADQAAGLPKGDQTDAEREAHRTALDEALAEELNISVAELQKAETTVFTNHVNELVADQKLTEEQGQQAIAAFASGDEKTARDIMRDARLSRAVEDGKLTQAQADDIRQNGPPEGGHGPRQGGRLDGTHAGRRPRWH
jgi:hypothetical protein